MNRPETVDKVLKGTEVKIVADEICVKSPRAMLGYFKEPEETKECIKDDWFQTGELGFLDEDGYLTITGRKKNLIILSNGENVSAERLEKMLLSFDEIAECVVCGKDNMVRATIVFLKYISSEDESKQKEINQKVEEIIHEVNLQLPSYARIFRWELRKEPFRKTTSQKIKRSEIEGE